MNKRDWITDFADYDGWIVCWESSPLWGTADPCRVVAIRKALLSIHAAGRSWRQLYRAGWRAQRVKIEASDGRP